MSKPTTWIAGTITAMLVISSFVYFNPPTPGRAFTKNQSATSQQGQVSGANHKRTSGDFSW